METTSIARGPALVRDSATWLGYLLIGYYAYLQASLGPMMPFLREEVGFDYTTAGLHFSALALGTIINGSSGDRVINRLGRKVAAWGGGAGVASGAVLLTLSPHVAVSLAGTLLMGYSGSLLGTTVQSMLADQHHGARAVALIESCIVASIFAFLAPLAVGFWQGTGLGWRLALWMAVLLLFLLGIRFFRTPLPPREHTNHAIHTSNGRIPAAFWPFWTANILGVSIEWSMIYWGASFLEEVGGVSKTVAATSMSLFLAAMLVGRIAGSRLARTYRSEHLLLGAVLVASIGFPLFWVGVFIQVRLLGLFIMGLGIANLYPLISSSAIGLMPGRSEVASARLSLGVGLALISVPLLLGWIADRLTVWQAYGIVALFLGLMLLTLLVAVRSSNRAGSLTTLYLPDSSKRSGAPTPGLIACSSEPEAGWPVDTGVAFPHNGSGSPAI